MFVPHGSCWLRLTDMIIGLKLLKHFNHENIIGLLDIITPETIDDFRVSRISNIRQRLL